MINHFEVQQATRINILNSIKPLTEKQLNYIPKGFNNSIIWNIGHVLVTQQLLIYGLSEQPFSISKKWIEDFKKGTTATDTITDIEINKIKSTLISTIETTKKDYENNVFKTYKTYLTSYNLTLKTVEDAIRFNNIHEGLHLGYIMAMKKLVIN